MSNKKSTQNLLNAIIMIKETLPKKQKALCNYIVENYHSLGLLTAAELAKSANVGISTIMNVTKRLGYKSFVEMRKDLYQISSSTTWWHLKESFRTDRNLPSITLTKIWEEITDVLSRSLTPMLIENFEKTVQYLLDAKTIHILGLRTSKPIALYFEQLLQEFYPKTRQISFNTEFIYDRILNFDPKDLLFVIAHSPYTNLTIEATQFCYKQGYKIVLLTDHLSCPITPYASTILKVETSQSQYSIVPSIALIEALVIEIGRQTSNQSIKHLEEIESILAKKRITRP